MLKRFLISLFLCLFVLKAKAEEVQFEELFPEPDQQTAYDLKVYKNERKRELKTQTFGLTFSTESLDGGAYTAQVVTDEEGIYFVDAEDIYSEMGLSLDSVSEMFVTNGINIRNLGSQVAYQPYILNGATGVVFYAEKIHTPFTDKNVYCFEKSQGLLWNRDFSVVPTNSVEGQCFTNVIEVFGEKNARFDAIKELKYGTAFGQNTYYNIDTKTRGLYYSFDLPGISGSDAYVSVQMFASIIYDVSLFKYYLYVNGTRFCTVSSYELAEPIDVTFSINNALESGNVLSGNRMSTYYGLGFLKKYSVAYERKMSAVDDYLEFTPLEGQTNIVTISELSSTNIVIVNVTDSLRPVIVDGLFFEDTNDGKYAVSFYNSEGSNSYILYPQDGSAFMEAYAVNREYNSLNLLLASNAYDYIMIEPDDDNISSEFRNALEDFAEYREGTGFSVLRVNLQTIYNQFAYGVKDLYAIKDFLQYAHTNWNIGPEYVLLCGIGTYDYYGLESDETKPNLIPPLLTFTGKDGVGMRATDSDYVDFDNDSIADIPIGRLPFYTSDKLVGYLQKLKNYEMRGEWHNDIGFICSRDEGDISANFPLQSDVVSRAVPEDFMSVNKLYQTSHSDISAQTINFINNGLGIINYFGHGAYNKFADSDSALVLDYADVDSLYNKETPSVFLQLTCDTGRFSHPSYTSIGETLTGGSYGGAALSFACTASSIDKWNYELGQIIMEDIFEKEIPRFGDVAFGALEQLQDQGVEDEYAFIFKTYSIFGDPALIIQYPKVIADAVAGKGTVEPDVSNLLYGERLIVTNTPAEHYYIKSVIVDGELITPTNLVEFVSVTNRHEVQTIFEGEPTEFIVHSEYGGCNYELGSNFAPYESSLTCSVTNSVVYSDDEGIRYVCVGWEGNGSVESGDGNSVDFILTNRTEISWLWNTQVLLRASCASNGIVNATAQWFDIGSTNAVVEVLPDEGFHFEYWTGDVPGGVSYDNPIELDMDGPRNIQAFVDYYAITPMAGTNGSIFPETTQKYPTGGSSDVFRIVPDLGFHIEDVLIDGVSTGAVRNIILENITSDHTVQAVFATNSTDYYSIQVNHNDLGYVSGPVGEFAEGTTVVFENIALDHSHIKDVVVDGNSIGREDSYSFDNIISNHTYEVVFEKDTNSVAITDSYSLCNLADGETFFDYGTEVYCYLDLAEFIPYENQDIKLINNGWVDGYGNIPETGFETSVNFQLTEDSGLTWNWDTQYWFEVSINDYEGGYVSMYSDWYYEGDFIYGEAVPAEHYNFVKWKGKDLNPPESTNSYIVISMPSEPYSLEAVFELEKYKINTIFDETKGMVTPGGIDAYYGTNITFDIIPYDHYYIHDVIVDDISIGATDSYTFDFVDDTHDLEVVFGTNSYDVIIDSPYDVSVPSVGTHSYFYSNLVEVIITNEVFYDENIAARYYPTGWVGSGSAPVIGEGTNCSFYIEEDSLVSWLWHTNYYLDVNVIGYGYLNYTSDWEAIDSTVDVTAFVTDSNSYHFIGWMGDTNGCWINGSNIKVPINSPREITALFKTNIYDIIASASGPGVIVPVGVSSVAHGSDSPVYSLIPNENAHISSVLIDGDSSDIAYNYVFENVTDYHSIHADFETNSDGFYSLVVDPPVTNGRIAASSYYFEEGSSLVITNLPDEHYHVSEVTINGTNIAPDEVIILNSVYSNILINTQFDIDTNYVYIAHSYGQSNYPEGTNWFDYGEYVTLEMTNQAVFFDGMKTQLFCYGWQGSGSIAAAGIGMKTSFNINEDSSINWLWNTQYVFAASSSGSGLVTSSNGWYNVGDIVYANAVADEGYHFAGWEGNVPAGMSNDNPISFAISNAVDITAVFNINIYTVEASSGFGGAVVPEDTVYVEHGSNATFNIVPDDHYHVLDVKIDGVSVGPVESWTFNGVTKNHTIYALFEIDSHDVVVHSAFGGNIPSGTNTYEYGTLIRCYVTNSPIINAETQYVCVGWSGQIGSVVTNGAGTDITLSLEDDTEITWNWQTNYWVDIGVGTGEGLVDMTSGWYKADSLLTPTATPSDDYHLSYWSGDIYAFKQFFILYEETLCITNDYPRNLYANFAPDNFVAENYLPGATNEVSGFPVYINSQTLYPLIDHYISGSSGICFATGIGDIMAYYDRYGYNGIPHWNLIPNGVAPLQQTEIYEEPGLNAADVASCITNVGYEFYVWYEDYGVPEREIIENYVRTKPMQDFDAVYHRVAETDETKEIFFNIIADEIDAGRPVLLGWYGGVFNAHYVVAIGYTRDLENITNSTVYIVENKQNPNSRRYVNFFGDGCGSLLMDTIIPYGVPEDIYEEYDSNSMSNTNVRIDPEHNYNFRQTHCFDETNDVDWVQCSLIYGREYYFNTTNLGSNAGTILELYSESGTLLDRSPEAAAGIGSTSHIKYTTVSNMNVYLKVQPADPAIYGYNANYDLEVTFSNKYASLEIYSEYGMTSMTNGTYEYLIGSQVTCSITNQTVYDSQTNGTKYTFSNWSINDGARAEESNSSIVSFTIEKDTFLSWHWQTNHWLDIISAANGSFDVVDSWIKHDSFISINAIPDQYYHFNCWTGDIESLTIDSDTIFGNITRPMSLSAVFDADIEAGGTPDWWLASYGLTNNFAYQETNDFDIDGFTSGDEYICGTDPTDSNSFFCISDIIMTNQDVVIRWVYAPERLYSISKTTNLFEFPIVLTNNLTTGVYTDRYESVEPEQIYYKINVRMSD